MWYGTRKKENMEQRRTEREKIEPSLGLQEFLKWFTDLERPITRVKLAELRNPYDDDREHDELQKSINTLRAEWWVLRGDIVEYGDTYDLRRPDED
jgi:hypothetical protein